MTSEQKLPRVKRSRRDDGSSLPELLIGIVLTGLIVSVLSVALITILRQNDNTEGRLNNARSEGNVGFYMPADLASAQEAVVTAANASPCYGAVPARYQRRRVERDVARMEHRDIDRDVHGRHVVQGFLPLRARRRRVAADPGQVLVDRQQGVDRRLRVRTSCSMTSTRHPPARCSCLARRCRTGS